MVLPRRGRMVVPDRGVALTFGPAMVLSMGGAWKLFVGGTVRPTPAEVTAYAAACGAYFGRFPSQVAAAAGYTGPQPSWRTAWHRHRSADRARSWHPGSGRSRSGRSRSRCSGSGGSRCRHRCRGLSGPRWYPDCPSYRRRSCRSCSCTCRPRSVAAPAARLQPRP